MSSSRFQPVKAYENTAFLSSPDRVAIDACERTQPGMSSRLYAKGGVLVPSEHHIGEFHHWVQARLGTQPR